MRCTRPTGARWRGSASASLPLPAELEQHAALQAIHLRKPRGSIGRVRALLDVACMKQVLSYQRHFERRQRTPRSAKIELGVSRCVLRADVTDVAQEAVDRVTAGGSPVHAQAGLLPRIAALERLFIRAFRGAAAAARVDVQRREPGLQIEIGARRPRQHELAAGLLRAEIIAEAAERRRRSADAVDE